MSKFLEKIKNYLSNIPPEKFELNSINKIKINQLPRGGYNLNFLIDLGPKKIILRANLIKYLDIKNQILYEYKTLNLIKDSRIAPAPFFYDISQNKLPYDILFEEYIKGKTIEINNQSLKKIGKTLKKLHSFPLKKQKWFIKYSNPLISHLNLIKKEFSLIKKINKENDYLNFFNPYIKKAQHYIQKNIKNYKPINFCLNHCDLVFENIINSPKGLFIIDWQSARIDDAAYDLAYFTSHLIPKWQNRKPLTKNQKKLFYSSYQANKNLLNKIKIRQPLIYLEIYVHITKKIAEIKDNLDKHKYPKNENKFWLKRIERYNNLLDKKDIKKDLAAFK